MGEGDRFSGLLALLQQIFSFWPQAIFLLLLATVYFLVEDPDRGFKLRALILEPLYNFFNLFPKQYLASKIGSSATAFLKRHVTRYVRAIDKFSVRIKWVTSPEDPILKKDGTVILHIPESKDQTLSIMQATRAALPSVVCKSLRDRVDGRYFQAIDLTIIRKLAAAIGPNATPAFRKHFLTPETAGDIELQRLLGELIEIDDHGIFTTIFLNELESFGFSTVDISDTRDYTDSIRGLLEFMLQFPRREPGKEIRLTYISSDFKLAVILVAIPSRAQLEGVAPYVDRVRKNLNAGVDSIYLYAYGPASDFLGKIRSTLMNDDRIVVGSTQRIAIKSNSSQVFTRKTYASLVHLLRNALFFDKDFEEVVEANSIAKGSRLEGRVVATASTSCIVEVCGLLAYLPREECSWRTVQSCAEVLSEGEIREFLINSVDTENSKLELSARFPENDPWDGIDIPAVGDQVQVKAQTLVRDNYVCTTDKELEVLIPTGHVSWYPWECEIENVIGQSLLGTITDVDKLNRKLHGSARDQNENPWPILQRDLVRGTKLDGEVVSIVDETVQVVTRNGLQGFILGSSIEANDMDFRDLKQIMSPGSKICVCVDRVFVERQTIRFNLSR